jgi:suppressor for copper-sensitivity B
MPKKFLSCVALAAAIASIASETRSQTPAPQVEISTELVVGEVSTDDDPFGGWIGVHVRLGPGWKIYWKSPGDTGLPPEFDWSASSNLAVAEVQWPVPHRAAMLGVESVGYTGDVLFPVKVQVEDPDFDASAELKLVLYACSTICIREERVLRADLSRPTGPGAQALIDRWRSKVPAQASPSLAIASIELLRSTPPRLRVEATSALPLEHPDLFVASTPPAIYASRPEVDRSGDRVVLISALQGDPADLARPLHIMVTLIDDTRAVEAAVPSEDTSSTRAQGSSHEPAASDGSGTWWRIMVTAWLGGLILNLMPCVFPVLSLKLLGFVNDDAAARRTLRSAFVASAAGVIVSFLVLATALVALRAAGGTLGWGIQFQHPVFLALMAAVIALFAANLLGLFELSLPPALMNALARHGGGSSVPSHFAGGFVATLLATPCSAPFVGTAVGFALSQGSLEIYAVLGVLGIGMATPYLLIACIPNLAAVLPRPGRWMLWVRRALAVPLLATSAWLVTLIGATAGHVPASLAAAALVVGVAALWWRATAPPPRTTIAVSSLVMLAGVGIIAALAPPAGVTDPQVSGIAWRPFGELDALVRSGRTILLDITADWCVTCKVNKALVLDDQVIAKRLAHDVVPVRADWTRPDARIAAYLKSFGRYGVPFNVVIGPGAPDGIVLPELLTTNAVLAAFARSSDRSRSSIERK